MLMMVEKRTRGGMVYEGHKYAMANNKYIKIMIKTFNRHTSCISMQRTFMDG